MVHHGADKELAVERTKRTVNENTLDFYFYYFHIFYGKFLA